YKALCPFHHERTPSFVVFPDTQTWRCFGACGIGGDVFSFVMKAEGWDFSEALRELASRAGVELKPLSPQQVDQQEATERLQSIVQEAAEFYHKRLLDARDAESAREYVRARHLSRETVEAFMVGYAPNDWREAIQHLQLIGYALDDILAAGIAIHNEDKNSTYDRFRHRLMIPIRDGRGRTVGFGARALDPADRAKYINSPQGPLFDKSAILFGLDLARRAIRESETAVIVEGYMDVMQAHQAGFQNVVAQMGTALTEPQLRQLDKYASRLVLALDPDTAGLNATMRGLNLARQTLDGEQAITFDPRGMMRYTGMLEMDIRVITLPEGKDPDVLIREDPDAWRALIASAMPVADFVIRQGTAHLSANASIHEREAAARELLPILTATESDLQRSGNVQALARELRLDERVLIAWTQHRQSARTRAQPSLREQRRLAGRSAPLPSSSAPPGQSEQREGFCLGLLLQQPEWLYSANRRLRELQGNDAALAPALGPLCTEDFRRPDYQAIFRAVESWLYQDAEPLGTYLARVLPGELV
ncbi:MAG: DNA primase, partial [Chloroflexota bacterium]